ncbi:dynein assembly factor 3, axonemal homolog isoform X1 [Drosophila innubila]|uniref:dynein assembly factor 3, axonemal homolog isoform X1 n=1 Tax=Drosophila innubila TaxID=198719 RepID=UPI00148DDC3C|nr:dynein assembly factor 3, axonemal homolog isoform X1 [Drosophila innubila]
MFWGLSSALDLYAEYVQAFKLPDDAADAPVAGQPTEMNILICGGADPRHVIKTLAKRYTHGCKPKLNFYVLDACVEIVARNMLILGLALEPPESFSLVCKTHLFMDIYGNSLMRPSSHHYMAAKGLTLLRMICDEELRQRLAPIFNIDAFKYRERDGLEMTFNYWRHPEEIFDIQRCWEHRVRSLLGPRYDHRQGAFDWDLSMTLKDREGQQICSQEYRYWRECGVAFVFPEYEHCKPNKTFAAGLTRNGRNYVHRGYVGDIQTGPFCAFGLRSSEERMHHSQHGENDYRATDVTERNLLELFHELQTQSTYEHDKTISRRYGQTQLLMTPLLSYNECDITEGQQKYDKPWIPVPDVQIHFMSIMDILELQKGTRWQDHFDIAFMAYNYNTYLSKQFLGALRERALFVMETKLMTVERKEHVQKFETKIRDLLKEAGLKPCINYQAINAKNMLLKYKKTLGGEVDDNMPEEESNELNEEDSNEMGLYITEIQEEKADEIEIKQQIQLNEEQPDGTSSEQTKREDLENVEKLKESNKMGLYTSEIQKVQTEEIEIKQQIQLNERQPDGISTKQEDLETEEKLKEEDTQLKKDINE